MISVMRKERRKRTKMVMSLQGYTIQEEEIDIRDQISSYLDERLDAHDSVSQLLWDCR